MLLSKVGRPGHWPFRLTVSAVARRQALLHAFRTRWLGVLFHCFLGIITTIALRAEAIVWRFLRFNCSTLCRLITDSMAFRPPLRRRSPSDDHNLGRLDERERSHALLEAQILTRIAGDD